MTRTTQLTALGVGILVAAVAVALWLRSPSEAPPAPREAASAPTPLSWEALDFDGFADAQLRIERLRKQASTDWSAVRSELERTLPVVRSIDLRHGLNYQTEMAAALGRCAKGERPKVHQQVIAKGLQHVAVLGMGHELQRLSSKPDTGAVDRVDAFAKGIRPTFVRRDKDYFEERPTLAAALDGALTALRDAVARKGDPAAAGRQLQDAVARTYALSVLYEVEQIEKLRVTDLEACEVKRKEAQIFYRIIAGRVSSTDAQADAAITAMLEASPDQMSAAALREHLQGGLLGIALLTES